MFILITGVDGSGKSTLARGLRDHLRTKGHKLKYVWIKSLHTLAYVLAQANLFGRYRLVANPNGVKIRRFEPAYRRLWAVIEVLSVLPLLFFKIYVPQLFNFTIIADRNVIDTVVTIAVRTQNPGFADSYLGRLLLALMPKRRVVIHLDLDIATLLERRWDIEYTRDELEYQLGLYRRIAAEVGAHTYDTSQLNSDETFNAAVTVIEEASRGVHQPISVGQE